MPDFLKMMESPTPANDAAKVSEDSTADDNDVQPPAKKFKGSEMLQAYLANSDDDDDSRVATAVPTEMLQMEIDRYDVSKVVHHSTQPSEFWLTAKNQYPLLSAIVCKLLAIPATSVASERMFITAGLVVSKLRASTSPELLAKILFLNKNASC